MKYLVIIAILALTCVIQTKGQSQGIFFERNLSWQQILEKAQKENKYVFVDCYATWCGPCKLMDKNVYPVDSVGDFMNKNFISVRIQMDTTKQDNDETRQLYATARYIEAKYHIGVYPTYLFFSPAGEAVHKDLGEKDIKGFEEMALAAIDYPLMPTLADAARRVGQDSVAGHVAHDYINHFLATLAEEQLWTIENIMFVNRYSGVVSIRDRIFQLYYGNRIKVDSVMNDGHYSGGLINYVLYRDDRGLAGNSDPNWRQLEKAIEKDYDALYAKKNILQGQVEYYRQKKQWASYIKYFIRRQEINGIENLEPNGSTSRILNNAAYQILQYSTNKRELKKALSWASKAVTMVSTPFPKAQEMDTKANLLYKLGKKSSGLSLEEESHNLTPWDKEIAANYTKMKSGLPTWSTE
jgi:thioredoxin-related protein